MNVTIIILLLGLTLVLYSKNPMKVSSLILIMALSMFFSMSSMSESNWLALMSALLFTGGILIMLMILSSFYPNETPKKVSVKIFFLTFMMFTLTNLMPTELQTQPQSGLKIYYHDLTTSSLLTLLIALYFSSFLLTIRKENSSMRLIFCQS